MTPAEQVRMTCEALGKGGQTKLAHLLPPNARGEPIHARTVRRWLAGTLVPHPLLLKAMEEIRNAQGGVDHGN